jgi:hypothetical protein
MPTNKPLQAVTLLLDSNRGVYIPRDFLAPGTNLPDWDHCQSWGLTSENQGQWIAACHPGNDAYWDAWTWILDNAEFKDADGNLYRLHHDGDLFGLCYERMTPEERANFGFDED